MATAWEKAKQGVSAAVHQTKKQSNLAALKARHQMLVRQLNKKKGQFGKEVYDYFEQQDQSHVSEIFAKYRDEVAKIRHNIEEVDRKMANLRKSEIAEVI